jgi:nucleoside-diphosphate-sugar epimerase
MQKVFIIWWSWLVWTHVLKEFLINGDSITSLTRSWECILWETVIQWSRSDKELLTKIFKENDFNLVIDMIPFETKDAQILADILNKTNISLIACSSADVYKAEWILWKTEKFHEYQKCPLKETDKLRENLSTKWESYNKIWIESIYLSLPWEVTIIRLPAIYGYPDTSRVEWYISEMMLGKTEIIVPEEKLNWKFCRALNKNCAYWVFLARHTQWKNIYNLAEEDVYTEKEWIEKLWKLYWWKWKVAWGENKEGLDFKQDWYLATSKIRDELWFYEKYNTNEGLFDAMLSFIHQKKKITHTKNY